MQVNRMRPAISHYNNTEVKKLRKMNQTLDLLIYGLSLSTNIALVLTLVNSTNSIEDESKGLEWILLCIPWLPGLILIPNEVNIKTEEEVTPSNNPLKMLIWGIICIAMFPAIILLKTIGIDILEDKIFRKASNIIDLNEILVGGLNLVYLLFMTLRGRFKNEENAVIYCLITMSLLLLVVMYLKASTQLLASTYCSSIRSNITLLPWLTSTLLFRTTAYAYILTFLGYWAVIPFIGLWLLLVVEQAWKAVDEEVKKEENCNHDGPYTMVWSGKRWARKYLHSSQKNETEEENKDSGRISIVFQGVMRLFCPFYGDDKKCEETKWIILENSFITLVLFYVFVAVNLIDSFHYEPNILSNRDFNLLTLILICLAILSSNLLNIGCNQCHSAIEFIVSLALLSSVIVISFILFFILKAEITININHKLFLFAVDDNSSGNYLDVLSRVNSIHEFSGSFEVSDVYLNFSCQEKLLDNKSLIFVDSKNPACKSLIAEASNKSIILINSNIQRRSSSPINSNPNTFYLEETLNLNHLNSSTIFIGNISFLLTIVRGQFNCSRDTEIELANHSSTCYQHKFLDSSGNIYEQRCINVDNHVYAVDLFCDQRFNSSFKPILQGIEQEPIILATNNDGYEITCCFNNTYFFQFYGSCNLNTAKATLPKLKFYERNKCSNLLKRLINVGYHIHDECLYKVYFESACDDFDKRLPTCFGLQCE